MEARHWKNEEEVCRSIGHVSKNDGDHSFLRSFTHTKKEYHVHEWPCSICSPTSVIRWEAIFVVICFMRQIFSFLLIGGDSVD